MVRCMQNMQVTRCVVGDGMRVRGRHSLFRIGGRDGEAGQSGCVKFLARGEAALASRLDNCCSCSFLPRRPARSRQRIVVFIVREPTRFPYPDLREARVWCTDVTESGRKCYCCEFRRQILAAQRKGASEQDRQRSVGLPNASCHMVHGCRGALCTGIHARSRGWFPYRGARKWDGPGPANRCTLPGKRTARVGANLSVWRIAANQD